MSQTCIRTSAARLRLGVGRTDITPPQDAYHRNWGAALHDAAEGIHRPLQATALLLQGIDSQVEHLLLTLDLGWLRTEEMNRLLARLGEAAGVDPARLTLTFSHTHSAVNLDLTRRAEPGGRHIEPYLETLPERLAAAIEAARGNLQPVDLTFARGHCSLAVQRDFWDDERGLFACGPNPEAPADDALWVAQAADLSGNPLIYLVNYACHPTTLAWENRLISPDYVGAMRALVEQTTGVPCLFLLGPCGDLGPRDGFVGDPAVADRNGRQLGYAALAAIESLPPPGTEMRYGGPVISGATLGIWKHQPFSAERLEQVEIFRSADLPLELEHKKMPSREELETAVEEWRGKEAAARSAGDELSMRDCRAHIERRRRALRRLEELPEDGRITYRLQFWQLGEGVLVAVGGEPYNLLQRELRTRFPETPVLLAVLCNQPHSYILPADQCGRGHYQDDCSTLAPGSLEQIIEAIGEQLKTWGLH